MDTEIKDTTAPLVFTGAIAAFQDADLRQVDWNEITLVWNNFLPPHKHTEISG